MDVFGQQEFGKIAILFALVNNVNQLLFHMQTTLLKIWSLGEVAKVSTLY